MALEEQIGKDLIQAMKAKDQATLRGIRAIKAAILLAKTDGSGKEMTPEREIEMLQKLVKQRRDSLAIFEEQNREDLAVKEREEIEVIQQYLPAQLTPEALEAEVGKIVAETGASSMKDMGKVMGALKSQVTGRADGKLVSQLVRDALS